MEFTINKDYAEKYNKWREKEEYQKLKDRYGDVSEGDSEDNSSSSESEDEDAEGLTPQIEKDWLTTLAAIKSKNPKIYDKDVEFYNQQSDSSNESTVMEKTKKSDKPMYLKDYERKVILEKGGKLSEDDSAGSEADNEDRPGYYEEQEQIRKSILAADVSTDSDEEFLTKRKKSKQQLEKEEADYIEWLKGQKDELDGEGSKAGVELDPLKNYWNDPKLPDEEKFLRDYILNKRYLEEDEGLPTYDEIVDFSEEEEQLEKEETFEHKYNFRFEDPDTEFIKSYPRTISDTVRRKDSKRAEKRQEVKERKQKEKDKIKEEIKQLKNLKRREIESRVHQLREVTGEKGRFNVEDLEGDFDPQAHDKLMEKMFSSDFYDQDAENEKPTWSDDEELDLEVPNWDNWKGDVSVSNHGDGGRQGDSDSGSDDSDDSEVKSDLAPVDSSDRELNATKSRHKKTKFQKLIEAKKPVFDPDQKSFSEYLEEYYKLDYEDIVAGQPCRFRYRNVVSNDFGLTTDEVLSAKETELNRWVSLKRMSQYRTQEEEKIDVKVFSKKARDVQKKMNVLTSLAETPEIPEQQTHTDKKKKKRRKKKKPGSQEQNPSPSKRKAEDTSGSGSAKKQKLNVVSETVTSSTTNDVIISEKQTTDGVKKSKKKKKKKDKDKINNSGSKEDRGFKSTTTTTTSNNSNKNNKTDKLLNKNKTAKNLKDRKKKPKKTGLMSDERLKAYGINPKKFKYTQKKEDGKS